jgi:hypothetical protein
MIPLLIVLLSWIAIEIEVAGAFCARGDPASTTPSNHMLLCASRRDRVNKVIGAQLDSGRTSIQGGKYEIGRPAHWFSRQRAALFAMLGEDDRALEELDANQKLNHWSRWWYVSDVDPPLNTCATTRASRRWPLHSSRTCVARA